MNNKDSSWTAIVVDDSEDIVELFSEFLEIKGVKVLAKGYNGKDAHELYKKFKPDVVFLDIMMPQYDGFYALKKIREEEPHAKIMMVTADLRAETAEKLEGLDSIALVYKPFDFDKIMQTLDKLMKSNNVDSMAFQGSTITYFKK